MSSGETERDAALNPAQLAILNAITDVTKRETMRRLFEKARSPETVRHVETKVERRARHGRERLLGFRK